MSPRVALATSADFPDLDEDGPALVGALTARGIEARPAVWSDPRVDWTSYDLVVVRSTWDYFHRRGEFLAWAERVAEATRLVNPADVLAWNTNKTYLRDLAAAGLPVVATEWLEPGDTFAVPEGEYVVKPAVSAGSNDTNRYRSGEHDDLAVAHVSALLAAGRTVMVQPYLDAVDADGETALLYFDGAYSHAIRKGALLTPAMGAVQGAYRPEELTPREPADVELTAAAVVLDALAGLAPAGREDLTYARVDLVPDADGVPMLLELELAEPSMFLIRDGHDGAVAADRFAAAIEAALP